MKSFTLLACVQIVSWIVLYRWLVVEISDSAAMPAAFAGAVCIAILVGYLFHRFAPPAKV